MKEPTSRDLAQARTREALMAAAERLLAERGFAGFSVAEVAGAAGFTKGAFYSNFESREAMMMALLRRLKDRQRAALKDLEALAGADFPRALDRLAEMTAHHAADPAAALLVAEVQLHARRDPAFAREADAAFQAQVAAVAGWIEATTTAAGVRPALPPAQLARTLMALTQGLSQQPARVGEAAPIMRAVLERLFER